MHDAVSQSDLYVFIHEKFFGTGGLCPKEEFINLAEIWGKMFKENIDHIIHMQNILGILFRLSQPATYNFYGACNVKTVHESKTPYRPETCQQMHVKETHWETKQKTGAIETFAISQLNFILITNVSIASVFKCTQLCELPLGVWEADCLYRVSAVVLS